MARGGWRPLAGRPKGATDKKPRKRRSDAKTPAKPKRTRKTSSKKPEAGPAPGPAPGSDDRLKKLVEHGVNAKAKIYSDLINKLARFSKGEPGATDLTLAEKRLMVKLGDELSKVAEPETAEPREAPNTPGTPETKTEDIDCSEFLKAVWNNSNIDMALRIRAAEVVFRGGGKQGKKEQRRELAGQASKGRFAPRQAPALKAVK